MPLKFWKPRDPLNDDGVIVVKIAYQGSSAKPIGQIEVFMSKTADPTQPFPDELRRAVPTSDIGSLISLVMSAEEKYGLAPRIDLGSGVAWEPEWGPMPAS